MAFRLLPQAEADITEIVLRIADDKPLTARRWHERLLRRCRQLGDMPGLGVARPDVRPGLRMYPFGNYLILYREAEQGADIVRVLHGARRWRELL